MIVSEHHGEKRATSSKQMRGLDLGGSDADLLWLQSEPEISLGNLSVQGPQWTHVVDSWNMAV